MNTADAYQRLKQNLTERQYRVVMKRGDSLFVIWEETDCFPHKRCLGEMSLDFHHVVGVIVLASWRHDDNWPVIHNNRAQINMLKPFVAMLDPSNQFSSYATFQQPKIEDFKRVR